MRQYLHPRLNDSSVRTEELQGEQRTALPELQRRFKAEMMVVEAALAFVLAGGSLLLLSPSPVFGARARVGRALALVVALIGALTLCQFFFGWRLGIDDLLLKEAADAAASSIPERMAPTAAINFLLLGLALLVIDWEPRRGLRPAEILALAAGLVSLISLAERVLDQPIVFGIGAYFRMAPYATAAFLALSTGVLLARPAQGVVGAIRSGAISRLEQVSYSALFLVFLALAVGGAWFYQEQEQQVRREVESELEAIARLKVDEIVQWRAERLGDASVLIDDAPFAENVNRWLAAPQAGLGQEILQRLRSMQRHYRYHDALLVDARGSIRLSLSGRAGAPEAEESQALASALALQRPLFSDLYVESAEQPPHADLIAPLVQKATGRFIGAVMLTIDARQFLYPLIQSWPTVSRSAETLLVRRDGDHAQFINDLRHLPDTAFGLRIPLSRQEVPAVMAVLGREGVFRGEDYRGVKVLSVLRAVPNSPWFMVTKIDESEALAEWRLRARLIVAVIAALALTLAAAGLMVWLQRSRYRALSRSAEALHVRTAQLRLQAAALDAAANIIVITDRDGTILWVNKAFSKLTGYSSEEAIGQTPRLLKSGIQDAEFYREMYQTILAGSVWRGETVNRYKDGRLGPEQMTITPLRGDDGEITHFIAINVDISERKRAEQEIRRLNTELEQRVIDRTAQLQAANTQLQAEIAERKQTEAALARLQRQHQTILDSVGEGVHGVDLSGNIIFENPAAEAMLGWNSHELVGQYAHALMHHTRADGAPCPQSECLIYAAFRDGQSRRVEDDVFWRKDGSSFPVAYTSSPMRNETGELIGAVVTFRDITERKRIEAQLRLQAAALDAAANSILITDRDGTILWVNQAFSGLTGYSSEEAIGQTPRLLSSGVQDAEFFRGMYQTILAGSVWQGEMVNRYKDGRLGSELMTITPLRGEDGEIACFIAIKQDITERKRSESELAQAKETAEAANRAKDSFLATMSHEIRTPLGGLTGMLELLSLTPLDAEQSETLQTARDSGRSLLRILNDILDWSKIEEGKLELAPQATSMADLVAAVVNTYAHVAGANSVTLSQQVDARLSPAHLVDPLRLSQVLNNFVSNAIKFSHGGRVELRAELVERIDDAEQVRFSVQDNGIGIAPEVQQRLFQQYSQASADTARMYGGTGLGLAICRRLADLMDGQIEVQSALGQGSTFSITLMLPIAAVVVETGQIPAGIEPAPFAPPLIAGVVAADAPLVLVVDDNPINRKLMVRQLALLGLRANSAENGELALALWRKGGYALVITDCHMPVMDGYALARQIRASEADKASEADRGAEADTAWPHTPILAWTANALPDEVENCRAAGMDELLVKPAELVQLKTLLAQWLPPTVIADSIRNPVPATTWTPDQVRGDNIPAVDTRVLAALVGDDPATIREFLQDFRLSAKASAAELLAACAAGDAVRVSAQAHKLKSAARAVGALGLGELCEQMEQAGNAGQLDALPGLAQSLEAEMTAVAAALQNFTASR